MFLNSSVIGARPEKCVMESEPWNQIVSFQNLAIRGRGLPLGHKKRKVLNSEVEVDSVCSAPVRGLAHD